MITAATPPVNSSVLLRLVLCNPDWREVPSAHDFPAIGSVLLEGGSKVRPGAAPFVVKPHQRAPSDVGKKGPIQGSSKALPGRSLVDADTNLARHGSNFGLPIALNLTLLMKGGIGIAEVRQATRAVALPVL